MPVSAATRSSMILSMTGFAAACRGAAGHFTCCRAALGQSPLPRRHGQAAGRAARRSKRRCASGIAAAQKRGKVECRVALARTVTAAAGGIAINSERVQQLGEAAASVARSDPGTPPLAAADILRWPGVHGRSDPFPPEALAERVDALVAARAVRADGCARARRAEAARRARGAVQRTSTGSSSALRRAFRRCTPRIWKSSARACARRGSSRTTIG